MNVEVPQQDVARQITKTPYRRLLSEDRVPAFDVERVGEARSEPPVRGERVLRFLEGGFTRLNQFARKAVPEDLNPFAQMGAIAVTTFLVALATGILLLFWYSPSVHHAFESVVGMEEVPWLAGLLRSLHRYSSDACMLFAVLHGMQILGARRFGGARWLGWVSGLILVGLLWFDGWTGYWLVWDERARQVALGTARFLDVLPFFADPLSRSFLTNETVNSLFFFIIFFIHMLIPLAMGVGLWIHIMRLNKARFLTGRAMTAAILASLVAVSLIDPATTARPADMGTVPQDLTVDGWYLLPLFLVDRLQGGVLWALALGTGVVLFGVPWWLTRRRAEPAVVDPCRCNGCMQCYQDCPYNAISLLPCDEGRREHPVVAYIDPDKCVGCGICIGSCDSSGIDQTRLPILDLRRWLNHHAVPSNGTPESSPFIAFACANAAGADLCIDGQGKSDALPGYRIVPVPCIGWVHMLTVERAFRHGARGVLLVGCDADPMCRAGADWTTQRLAGNREPSLRRHKVPTDKIRYVRYNRTDQRALQQAAAAFRRGEPVQDDRPVRRPLRYVLVAVLLVALGSLTLLLSDAPYAAPNTASSELVISFKHAGQLVEKADATPTDQDDLLPHMRRARTTERVRVPVRMRVLLDGEEIIDRTYEPGGLFGDGNSLAIETLPVSEGTHRVHVFLGDTQDPDDWPYEEAWLLTFHHGERRVVLFNAASGFSWH